jgi:hypothetical protein
MCFGLLLYLAGCSNTTASFGEFVNMVKIENIQVSVLDRPTEITDDNSKVQGLYKLLEDVTLTEATSEEMLKIHRLENSAQYESIVVMINTKVEPTALTVLNDGRLSLIIFEDGLGKHLYKLPEKSPSLYNEMLSFYEEQLEDPNATQVQVLDAFEEGDEEVEIEVDLIRESVR